MLGLEWVGSIIQAGADGDQTSGGMGMSLERGEIQEIYKRLSTEPGDGLVLMMGDASWVSGLAG